MIPPSTYDCPICDQVCPSLAQYISHYEKAHDRSATGPGSAAAAAEGAARHDAPGTRYPNGCPILDDEGEERE
jgi:hypothetical protein